nr:1194_t:CDS:2 [Entrophospora candida]
MRENHQTAHNVPNQYSNAQHTNKHSTSNQDWSNFIDQLKVQLNINPGERPEEFHGAINKLIGENHYFVNFINKLQKRFGINLDPERILKVIDNLISENGCIKHFINQLQTQFSINQGEALGIILERIFAIIISLLNEKKRLTEENQDFNESMKIYEANNKELARYQNEVVPQLNQVIESQSAKHTDLATKYDELHAEKESLTIELNKYKVFESKYSQLHADNEKLTNELNNYKEQIKNMELQYNSNIVEMGEFYGKKIRELEAENNSKIAKSEEKGNYYFDELVKNKEKLDKYQQEIEPKYIEQIKSLNNNLEINQQEITTLKTNISRAKANYDKLNKDYNNDKIYQDNKIAELITESQNKTLFINDLEKSKRELEATNEKLRKEASSYQSALGDALNFRLSDEDNNNSVQLSADINSLQDKLEKYVTTLKGQIKIDNDKIQGLYGKYNLDTQNLTDKILMKSVLQRHVLEKILEYIDNYLEIKDDDEPSIPNNQEKYIMDHTNELIFLLDKFYNNHFEQDNNTYENKIKQYTHPFISSTALELNQFMAGYRYIKDDAKRKNVENMAENLIKDIIQIFKFRLLVQEPKCETRWFKKGIKINPQFMKGQWDDDCLDDYVVDICYFPLIGMELDDLSKSAIKGIIKYMTPATSSSIPSQNSANNDHNRDPNKRQNSVGSDRNRDLDKRQNSASSDRNNGPDKHQNSANNDHNRDPNKRQNSASSDRNRDLDKRQNSASSDRNNGPDKHQNSVNNDHNRDPNKRQNSASSDHNSDSNKRQNSASSDRSNGPDKHQNSVNNDRNRDSYKHQNSASSDHNSDSNKRQNSDNNDCNRDQKKHQSSASSDPNDNNLSHNHSHYQKNHSQNFNNQSLGGNEFQAKPHVQSRPIGNVDSPNLSQTSSKNSTNTKGNNNETSRPHIENSETPSAPSTNDGASTSLPSSKEINDPQDNNDKVITTTSNVNNNGGSNTGDNKTTDNNANNQDNKSKNNENIGNEGSETRGSVTRGIEIEGSKIKGGKNQTDSLVLGDDGGKVTGENGNGKNSQDKGIVGKQKGNKKDGRDKDKDKDKNTKVKKVDKPTGDDQGKKKNLGCGHQSNNDSLDEEDYVDVKKET